MPRGDTIESKIVDYFQQAPFGEANVTLNIVKGLMRTRAEAEATDDAPAAPRRKRRARKAKTDGGGAAVLGAYQEGAAAAKGTGKAQ
jgi:hypothetical protein